MVYHMYGNFGKQINNNGGGGGGGTTLPPPTSVAEVLSRYKDGTYTYWQAYELLRNSPFFLSDGEATDVLTVEIDDILDDANNDDSGGSEGNGDGDGDNSDGDGDSTPWFWDTLTPDQKYFWFGLIVIGVLYFVVWRDE